MSHPRPKNKSKKTAMHPADINAAIIKANSSHKSIATDLDVDSSAVAAVIYSRSKSKRIALKIAEITNLSVETMFADAYNYDGRGSHKDMVAGARHG